MHAAAYAALKICVMRGARKNAYPWTRRGEYVCSAGCDVFGIERSLA